MPTEYHDPEGATQDATFRIQEVTANKLKELLKRYKGGKALGGDELDGYLMKTASRVILPALLHIINLSIKEGQFADRWKFEVVCPHFKKAADISWTTTDQYAT